MKRSNGFNPMTVKYIQTYNEIFNRMKQGMCNAQLTNSISANFISQMIPHHRAAIEMSRNVLRYTNNAELRKIATNIISEQTKSIENMECIKCACASLSNSAADLEKYQNCMNNIMQKMFSEMGNARTTNHISCNFMWEMIPHHRGAVEMSENALKFPICNSLDPILKDIISSQKKGIAEMEKLLKQIGCQ